MGIEKFCDCIKGYGCEVFRWFVIDFYFLFFLICVLNVRLSLFVLCGFLGLNLLMNLMNLLSGSGL